MVPMPVEVYEDVDFNPMGGTAVEIASLEQRLRDGYRNADYTGRRKMLVWHSCMRSEFDAIEREEAILAYIREHPGAYAPDIANALDLPMRHVFAACDALMAEGAIEED